MSKRRTWAVSGDRSAVPAPWHHLVSRSLRPISAIAVLVLWSSAALAQTAGAQAETLFRQGRDLLAAGKVAEACSAFDESQKLDPAVSTLLNLAACREKLGQLATAWGLFLDAARQTRSAGDATTQQLHATATSRAGKLEPRVSKLTINVPQQSQVDGLEIARNGERVNPGLWNRALPIDGGSYTITARAPGANQWSTQVTVAAAHDSRTVEIPDLRNLPRDVEKPAVAARAPVAATDAVTPVAPAADPGSEPASRSKVVPLVVGAAGLALLGTGVGFELSARSQYDAAKAETMNQQRRDSLQDSANTRRYVAQGLAAAGVVAAGAAVWLYLRSGSDDATASARIRVVPSADGVVVFGQF